MSQVGPGNSLLYEEIDRKGERGSPSIVTTSSPRVMPRPARLLGVLSLTYLYVNKERDTRGGTIIGALFLLVASRALHATEHGDIRFVRTSRRDINADAGLCFAAIIDELSPLLDSTSAYNHQCQLKRNRALLCLVEYTTKLGRRER